LRVLLDTHAFLWWDIAPDELSPVARACLEHPENTVLLSVVSVWEMQIKAQLGRLTLRLPLATLIREQQERNGFVMLPVTLEHVLAVQDLPNRHKDPFDRLLIAQALAEDATLLSRDAVFSSYPVRVLW
jgi:PIN domain nuclease of toxin-antitoxin system